MHWEQKMVRIQIFGSYIGTAGAAAAGAVIGAVAGSVLGTLAGKHPQISGKAAEHKTMKPAAKEKNRSRPQI